MFVHRSASILRNEKHLLTLTVFKCAERQPFADFPLRWLQQPRLGHSTARCQILHQVSRVGGRGPSTQVIICCFLKHVSWIGGSSARTQTSALLWDAHVRSGILAYCLKFSTHNLCRQRETRLFISNRGILFK